MNSMDFPNAWRKFLQDYSFKDKEQIYTNGSELIPVFRVEQMIEQYLVEKQTCEYWYQGYYKLLGELANYKWIKCSDRLPEEEIKECIIYDTNRKCVRSSVWCHGHWLDDDGYFWLDDYVTHWMPLPAPPEKPYEEWDRIAKEREQ